MLIDNDTVYNEYIVNEKSAKSIATQYGVSEYVVEKALRKLNITRPIRGENSRSAISRRRLIENDSRYSDKDVSNISGEFVGTKEGIIKKGNVIGKSEYTFYMWYKCGKCGKERWVICSKNGNMKLSKRNPCRSCGMRGHRPHIWKNGGRSKSPHGYILIRLNRDSPYFCMCNSNGSVFEHRLIMAKHLGRVLEKWEVVHHINGIKDDNRIENLELLPSDSEHTPDFLLKNYVRRLEIKYRKLQVELSKYVKV